MSAPKKNLNKLTHSFFVVITFLSLILLTPAAFSVGMPLYFLNTISQQTVTAKQNFQITVNLNNQTGQVLPLSFKFQGNNNDWHIISAISSCSPGTCQGNLLIQAPNTPQTVPAKIQVCYGGRYCNDSNNFSVEVKNAPPTNLPILVLLNKPTFPAQTPIAGSVNFLYEIKNTGNAPALLNNIIKNVTDGSLVINTLRTTCSNMLNPNATCMLAYTYHTPPYQGAATGMISINYGGSSVLNIDDLAFTYNNPLFIYATDGLNNSNAKVAYCKIDPTTKLLHNCQIPSSPTFSDAEGIVFSSSGDKVYVSNRLNNSISICDINPMTGALSNCNETPLASLNAPEGMAVTPNGLRIYIANRDANNILVCDLSPLNGSISNCQTSALGTNSPEGVAINGNVTKLYIANHNNAGLTLCDINAITGLLQNCQKTPNITNIFSDPRDVVLNLQNTFAYIVNRINDTVTVCQINGLSGELSNCQQAASGFSDPEGLTISPDGNNIYVGNWSNVRGITPCSINLNNQLTCGTRTPINIRVDHVDINGVINLN